MHKLLQARERLMAQLVQMLNAMGDDPVGLAATSAAPAPSAMQRASDRGGVSSHAGAVPAASVQETLDQLSSNFWKQSELLTMLHGAGAYLGVRAPLVIAHMIVYSYPWVPDLVIAVQLTSGLFLPPSFHAAGVGASAADVRYAQARLQELGGLAAAAAALQGAPAAPGATP